MMEKLQLLLDVLRDYPAILRWLTDEERKAVDAALEDLDTAYEKIVPLVMHPILLAIPPLDSPHPLNVDGVMRLTNQEAEHPTDQEINLAPSKRNLERAVEKVRDELKKVPERKPAS